MHTTNIYFKKLAQVSDRMSYRVQQKTVQNWGGGGEQPVFVGDDGWGLVKSGGWCFALAWNLLALSSLRWSFAR